MATDSRALFAENQAYNVYAISDLHVDYTDNMKWVESIEPERYQQDVLLIAGDVSDSIHNLRHALCSLCKKFRFVFFVPGNHELWVHGNQAAKQAPEGCSSSADSIQKLQEVLRLCDELGVITNPTKVSSDLWIVPLIAWHHGSWDTEPDVPYVPVAGKMTIGDYSKCVWPETVPGHSKLGSERLARWVSESMNDNDLLQSIAADFGARVISLSHFLPFQELLPEKRFLYYPNLAKAVGSRFLAAQVTALQPDIHIFGHTHFAWDQTVKGIRCIQPPLCYPGERASRMKTIRMNGLNAAWTPARLPNGEQPAPDPTDGSVAEGLSPVPWLPLKICQKVVQADVLAHKNETREHSDDAGSLSAHMHPARTGSMEGEAARHIEFAGARHFGAGQVPTWAVRAVPDTAVGAESRVLETQYGRQAVETSAATFRASSIQFVPKLSASWSDYYCQNARRPEDVELVPWVKVRYQRRQRLLEGLRKGGEPRKD